MAETLIDYLKNKDVIGFESRLIYSQDGDFLTLFLKDEDHYSERVDDLLTIYYSTQSDELIGCKIKGVQRLIEALGHFGVSVGEGDVQLKWLFIAGALISPASQAKYQSLSKRASDARIPRRELLPTYA